MYASLLLDFGILDLSPLVDRFSCRLRCTLHSVRILLSLSVKN